MLRSQTPDDLRWRLPFRDLHHRRVLGGMESGAGRIRAVFAIVCACKRLCCCVVLDAVIASPSGLNRLLGLNMA